MDFVNRSCVAYMPLLHTFPPPPQALPGAVDTFLHFRQLGVPWLFVTNTTTTTRDGGALTASRFPQAAWTSCHPLEPCSRTPHLAACFLHPPACPPVRTANTLPPHHPAAVPAAALAQRLRAMGIPASPEDILSPAKLAAEWLRNNEAGEGEVTAVDALYGSRHWNTRLRTTQGTPRSS